MYNNQIDRSGKRTTEDNRRESSAVDFSAVEIRTLNGDARRRFSHGDAVEIRVHYEAKKPIFGPNLVLRVTRADGTTCCMIRTSDYGHELDDLNGKGVISVAVDPLQLASGAYTVEAKLMMKSVDGVPLALKHSTWFEVDGVSLGYEEASGVFVPQVKWARLETPGQIT
jgi:hypothetical protein